MVEKQRKLFNKKWLIALSVLVLIGIVVTLVIVFLPKDTKKAVAKVHNAEETMFLVSQTETLAFEEFYGKFGTSHEYRVEGEMISKISANLNYMISFYNDYLIYANADKTFQGNYNHIVGGIDKANKSQKSMNEVLKDVSDFVPDSTTYLKTAWRDFRKDWVGYLKGYQETIEGLSKVYKFSLPKGAIQNKFSYLVLDTANDYIDEIIVKFEALVKSDVKDSATITTFEKNQGKAISEKFCNFVVKYVNSGIMNEYYYSQNLQQDVNNIEKFESAYNKSISDVIKSGVSADNVWNMSAVAADTNSTALNAVKKFLDGGCQV